MAKKSKAATTKAEKPSYVEFEVDLWVTNFNTTEVGIYQKSRHRAKSRQFTKDMDIYADVEENGERSGFLAYRKGLWKNHEGMDKRLVIKLFSEDMNWRGTMDLLLGRSLQLTHGAKGFPVTAFSMNMSGHDQLVTLERSAYKWAVQPERFSFFLLRDGIPHFYRIKRNLVNIGDDYTLFDDHGKKVGKLNGRVLNLGGKWKCWVEEKHCDKNMKQILQLFCGMLRFNTECRHHIEDLMSDMKKGRFVPKLEQQESELYMNPRRTR